MGYAAERERIRQALEHARAALRAFTPGQIASAQKAGGDPVTEADRVVDDVLRECLPQAGEGWLSEETVDDAARLSAERVWIVDPLDGTKEFVAGIPEWCVSVGLIEDGRPVAGGICNPVADQLILGAVGEGVTLNGEPVGARAVASLDGAEVLASNSEVRRGEWERFSDQGFSVRPVGSVAYKLGLVAAGLADVTWTLVPKNEWDVAAGAALVLASGGAVWLPDGESPTFNRPHTLFDGFLAAPATLEAAVRQVTSTTGHP